MHIPPFDNQNKPIVNENNKVLSLTYFNLVKLQQDEDFLQVMTGFESVCVVLSGKCDIQVDGETFNNIGGRKDIWSGKADSVYAPLGASIKLTAKSAMTGAWMP